MKTGFMASSPPAGPAGAAPTVVFLDFKHDRRADGKPFLLRPGHG
jgi:hypothetical protein